MSIIWYFDMDDSSLIISQTTPDTWTLFVKKFELVQVMFDHNHNFILLMFKSRIAQNQKLNFLKCTVLTFATASIWNKMHRLVF